MSQIEQLPEEDRPPFFRKWSSWYGLVAGFLFLQILIYFLITQISG